MEKLFNNPEIVTIAVYLLGGDSKAIGTEDIAVKANKLAPGRFIWRKYHDQINLFVIRNSLSDARKSKFGSLLIGSDEGGWSLTEAGLKFSKEKSKVIKKNIGVSRKAISKKNEVQLRREKIRMLSTLAYEKVNSGKADDITRHEAEAFFRIDEYITGENRKNKITRIKTAFHDDPDLSPIIKLLAERIMKNDNK
jgi:hypothetical protein